MAPEGMVSWARIVSLWAWSLYGIGFHLLPALVFFRTDEDVDKVKDFYDQMMRYMGETPESFAPDFALFVYGIAAMQGVQTYGTFVFFLATNQTEHFRVRCCQFFAINRLVMCPFVYLYAAYHWDIHVQQYAYMSLFGATVFIFLGFVAPSTWPIEVATPSKFEPSVFCDKLVSWIREIWIWYWAATNSLIFLLPFCLKGLDTGVHLMFESTLQVDFVPTFSKPVDTRYTDFTKMSELVLGLYNTSFSFALLFFLATVRTECFRVCACLFLALDLALWTPFCYYGMAIKWSLNEMGPFYADRATGAICGFLGILGIVTSVIFKKKAADAKESSTYDPLLAA